MPVMKNLYYISGLKSTIFQTLCWILGSWKISGPMFNGLLFINSIKNINLEYSAFFIFRNSVCPWYSRKAWAL